MHKAKGLIPSITKQTTTKKVNNNKKENPTGWYRLTSVILATQEDGCSGQPKQKTRDAHLNREIWAQ
jgi:hypothetical protein